MAAYILVAIWVISHFICVYILRRRNVKTGLTLDILGVFLGPFAIPLAFIAGRKPSPEKPPR